MNHSAMGRKGEVMKVLVVFCFVCLLAIAAVAQQGTIVQGKVSVGTEKTVIAKIVLRGAAQSFEVTTNSDGFFKIANVPNGKYKMQVTANNQALTTNDVNVERGKTIFIVVTSTGGSNAITSFGLSEEVNVEIAAGESQPLSGVSKTVNVIDGQEMRDRADFSLVESLRTIPGFRVAQSGGFGKVATIKTRGLRNQDTAILIDGIRFRDASAISGDATSFISDLTLTSVAKVEVLRGSGSSLYGTNAIGGVVDFQTPEAKSGTHGQIGGAFGGLGLGRFRGNISHGTSEGKFGVTAGISRTAYTKGIDGDDAAHNTNFHTRIDGRLADKTHISGRIFYSDADVKLNSSPDTKGTLPTSNATIINANQGVNFVFDANDSDNKQKSRFFDGQIVVNQVINSKFVVSGYYQGLTTKRTNTNGPLGVGFQSASTSVFDGTIHTGNVHFNWTPVRENTLTAGYEFESERFGNDGKTPSGTANFFVKAGQKSNTFYVQDLVSLVGGNLQFAGGVRVQRYGLDRPTFSLTNAPYNNLALSNPPTAYTFDGAASYFFAKSGTKLRTHVGNGYRVPSLYERFGTFFNTFPSNAFVALGDPFLKPEKTIAFDAGVEQNVSQDRVRLSATYFYTRLNDIIGFGNTASNIGTTTRPFGGYVNQKGGTARGGEFSVKARATATTDLFASYTHTDSRQLTPQVSGTGILKTFGVPDHQFTLVATQRFGRAWVNFDFLATSTYLAPIFSNTSFSTYVYRFNGNRKGDLTGGYSFALKTDKTLRVYGTVENVFNQEYYENGFRTAKTTARVGMTFGF